MKCLLRLRSNPRGQKQYVVVNVTIKYYFILCCINVKADLPWTVRPDPISKHKLTVNRKTGTIFQVGLRFLFRQKEIWPVPKSIVDYRWLDLRAVGGFGDVFWFIMFFFGSIFRKIFTWMENVFRFCVFTEFFRNPRTYKEEHPHPPPHQVFWSFFLKDANISTCRFQ